MAFAIQNPGPFFNFSTGSTLLPDLGQLSYNGIIFSPIFKSKMRGKAVKDLANRTVKYMEWTLEVEGHVTLGVVAETIDDSVLALRTALNQQAGTLIYTGRGFGGIEGGLVVNPVGGGGVRDVAWGPIPEILDFVPTGGGLSALVHWVITTRIPVGGALGGAGVQGLFKGAQFIPEMLQFNEDISITYKEDGYSQIAIRGTMELAQTRDKQTDRSVDTDDLEFNRQIVMDQVVQSIDLTRFLMPTRSFKFSRDRRTMEWEFLADEQPPMGLPPWATQARGTFSVRPKKPGAGIVWWNCSLRCSYVIRKDFDRNNAWRAFLALVNARMRAHVNGVAGTVDVKTVEDQIPKEVKAALVGGGAAVGFGVGGPVGAAVGATAAVLWNSLFSKKVTKVTKVKQPAQAMAIHWGLDEGIYLDSKTVSFEVSWFLITTFSTVLIACGFLQDSGIEGGNVWKRSIQDIVGGRSWLENQLGNLEDVIVDFGGPV